MRRYLAVLSASWLLLGAGTPPAESLRANPQAMQVYAHALAARDAAQAADAYHYAGAQWERAESALAAAASAFARGGRDDSTRRAADVESLYRGAEQAAIAAALLAEPRNVLAQARKAKAGRYAPETLERAEAALTETEQALASTPPDRERATDAAARALAEARRALALSTQLASASPEAALLAWEGALGRVADSAAVTLPSAGDPEASAAAIVTTIERERAERARLEQELAERNEQIRQLQTQASSLTTELDGVARERLDLARQLETQEEARARLAKIENAFAPGEAEVLRERDDVVIRLLGLKFAPGASKLGSGQQALLDKVLDSVALYGDREIVVEGHTDAAGSADANLELSRARARAVRDYLIASGRLLPARVTSEGYGESRPIASNDTDEGRAHNRRIDIRLHPLQN
jgi:outer membrane protein OmpA-like peptidoglycan-associated protein